MTTLPTIDFKNMESWSDFQAYSKELLDQLADVSPSDAQIRAVVEKDAGGFWATLRINSSEMSFIDTEFARSPFAALDRAIGKAKDQIFDWCFKRASFGSD